MMGTTASTPPHPRVPIDKTSLFEGTKVAGPRLRDRVGPAPGHELSLSSHSKPGSWLRGSHVIPLWPAGPSGASAFGGRPVRVTAELGP